MTEVPTFEVDADKMCDACGKPGAGVADKCPKCFAMLLKHFKGRAIGFLTLTRAKTELCAYIDEAAKEIDMAYIKADGDLTVDLKLKLAGTRMAGEIETVVTINFVEGRFKRAKKFVVNENQASFAGMET
ncbi:unnamed protein product [marine sediment metagenome]|uniref:Uncharacterized protein n=1 Tax=marine sediment metagenome TaxID=412755 RepID=X0VC29_9ZZZZ